MQLEVKNNNFVNLTNLIKVVNIKADLKDYEFNNNRISGIFIIKGKYIKDTIDRFQDFEEEIPFEILFTMPVNIINNVTLKDFEYFEVERRGIETEFTLTVEYESDDFESSLNNTTEYDNIKKEVEQKLNESLDVFDHSESLNLPTTEQTIKIRIKF